VSKGYEVGPLLSPATSASIQYTAENGAVSVTYPSAEIETAVLRAGSAQVDEVDAILDEEIVDDVNAGGAISKKELTELRATIDTWGRSWREIPLEDQKIKFAVSLPRHTVLSCPYCLLQIDHQTTDTTSGTSCV